MAISIDPAELGTDGGKRRLRARLVPALSRVLEEHRACDSVPVGALVESVLDALRAGTPRLATRERLIADHGGRPVCWICGLEIPLDAPEDCAESFSVDHVVPQSAGGKHMDSRTFAALIASVMPSAMHPMPRKSPRPLSRR